MSKVYKRSINSPLRFVEKQSEPKCKCNMKFGSLGTDIVIVLTCTGYVYLLRLKVHWIKPVTEITPTRTTAFTVVDNVATEICANFQNSCKCCLTVLSFNLPLWFQNRMIIRRWRVQRSLVIDKAFSPWSQIMAMFSCTLTAEQNHTTALLKGFHVNVQT